MQAMDDSVRSAWLKKTFADIKETKKLLKPYKGMRSSRIADRAEQELYENLEMHLRHLRNDLKVLDYRDALKARENAIKSRIREEGNNWLELAFYENSDQSRISYIPFIDDNGLPVKETKKRIRVFTSARRIGNKDDDAYAGINIFSSKLYWKDNFKKFISSNGKEPLFSKSKYFRIGDMFYEWKKYFYFNGQAYDRSKWGLYEGQIKDLKKSLPIVSDSSKARNGNMAVRLYKKRFFLDSMPNEEFELRNNPGKYFLRIRVANNGQFSHGLSEDNFLFSMFKNKNKRFFTRNTEALYLTKEDCCGLEFAPSENHRNLFGEMLKGYQEYCRTKGQNNEGSIYYTKSLESRYNNTLIFEVSYADGEDDGKSIKAQILQELFSSGDYYRPAELKVRIKALSEILTEEAKYGSNKKQKKSDNF